MSDIKLFRLSGDGVEEMASEAHGLEKHLQNLIEENLEPLLGVRFLASEYSTGPVHGGRMDPLGIDENNSPVIIEYKRIKSENVINQGLFYLDWLLDHQAEFALLVMERLGAEMKDKVDWTNPRLLCIAQDFTRYDEHAVNQMNRNIDLIRYRKYGDQFMLFELVNATSATPDSGGSSGGGTTKPAATYKTVDEYLTESSPALRELYDDLQAKLMALGDDVQEKHLKYYIAFKRLRNFACVEIRIQKQELLIYLKVDPTSVALEEGFSRDVSNIGHFGTGDLEVTVRSHGDLDRAMVLIEQSYEAS